MFGMYHPGWYSTPKEEPKKERDPNLIDCLHCNGSGEGQVFDLDTRMMKTIPGGCNRCNGKKSVPK